MVEKLPVGEYTLREEQAPDGYLIAEDVKFTVKDTGKVQKVKMKDAHPYGKLVIKRPIPPVRQPFQEQNLNCVKRKAEKS